jgi:hypothetical protein
MAESAKRQEERQEEFAKQQEERHAKFLKQQEESDKRQEERNAEFEKQQKERHAESVKRQQESARRQEELNKNFHEQLGKLTNLFGQFTEAMLTPALSKKFMEFGFDFQTTSRNVEVKSKDHKTLLEIDIMMENGEKVMLVEVKTKLTIERINYHIERLEKMRAHADSRGDKRIFLGAVAGVVVTEQEKRYALNQGLYLIETSGENLFITPPNGKPKEW